MSETIVAPDPNTEPQAGPDLFPSPQTQTPNETPSDSVAAPNTILERVKSAAGKVFESRGIRYKRTGGRPRADGLPNKGDIPMDVPTSALPVGSAAPAAASMPTLDLSLVKQCCTSVFRAAQTFLDRLVFGKAKAAGLDAKEAQSLILDSKITQEETDAFSELAGICLQRHGVGTQYAPEVGMTIILAGIGVRYAMVIQRLDEQAQVKPANQGASNESKA